MTNSNWIILEDNGEFKRYNLASLTRLYIKIPSPTWTIDASLEEVYLMPQSKRVILKTRNDEFGIRYRLADPDIIARIAEYTGDERLIELVPVSEDC